MIDEHLSVAERRRAFSPAERERLRVALDPNAAAVEVRPLMGGVDTATYAVRLGHRDVVLRVYRGWKGDVADKVKRDYALLETVSANTTLAPRPILCDAPGKLVGEPLIALTMLKGAPLAPSSQNAGWTDQLAAALVAIHAIPVARLAGIERDRTPRERLARRLADPPREPDPLWDEIVAVLPGLLDRIKGNSPTLIHGDFWFGNTVWQEGRLSGVVDWGGARIGDPATDVAIARADLRLFSGERPAEDFLTRYEAARGRLSDLVFWDLLAALDPIRWLTHWIAGYEELGVALPLGDARARLERWVAADLVAANE